MAEKVTMQEIINSIEHIEKLLTQLRVTMQGMDSQNLQIEMDFVDTPSKPSVQYYKHDGFIGKACNK
jgi:hypothetical protein